MNTIQRWRPTKGDINKIKMEASGSGKYVRYASYLDECEKLRAEVERLRAENVKKDEWIAELDAAVDRLGEDWAKQHVELLQQSDALELAKMALLEISYRSIREALAAIEALPAAPVDPIRALIARHAEIVEDGNEYAYFELAYTRATGWMAWITDKPLTNPHVANPDRKVIARGQGSSAEEACRIAAASKGGA